MIAPYGYYRLLQQLCPSEELWTKKEIVEFFEVSKDEFGQATNRLNVSPYRSGNGVFHYDIVDAVRIVAKIIDTRLENRAYCKVCGREFIRTHTMHLTCGERVCVNERVRQWRLKPYNPEGLSGWHREFHERLKMYRKGNHEQEKWATFSNVCRATPNLSKTQILWMRTKGFIRARPGGGCFLTRLGRPAFEYNIGEAQLADEVYCEYMRKNGK
jgi:hypothetical protein